MKHEKESKKIIKGPERALSGEGDPLMATYEGES